MSYSQLVLSENPYGYWEFSDTPVYYDYFPFNNIEYNDSYYDLYDEGTFLGLSFDNTVYLEKYFRIYGENIIEYQNNLSYTDTYGSFYDIWAFEVKDFSIRSNNALVLGQPGLGYKPIVPGCQRSVKFNNTDLMIIPNIYNLFLTGSENKDFYIEMFFSIESSLIDSSHDLITVGNLFKCFVKSDKIYLQSGDSQVFVSVPTWDAANYVAVSYENRVLSLIVNNNPVQRVVLGENYLMPDLNAPDIVIGPSASSNSSFYVNSLALYSYVLTNDQVNRRLAWSNYLPSTFDISVVNEGSTFNPSYNSLISQEKILLTSSDTLSTTLVDNVEVFSDSIRLRQYSQPQIIGNNVSISSSDTKFGSGSYLNLVNLKDVLNNYNSTIRLQAKVGGQASNLTYQNIYNNYYGLFDTEETLFEFGPLDNYISCRVYKNTDKKICVSLTYVDGTEQNIIESSAISNFSVYHDIALNFDNQNAYLIVDGQQFNYSLPFPAISSSPFFRVGNSSTGDTPSAYGIKNFSIDNLTQLAELDFDSIGKYTVSMINNLTVSQKGYWYYSYTPVSPILSSYISFNTASSNSKVYVNGTQITKSGVVPGIDYQDTDPITIKIELQSQDAENDLAIFNNLYLIIYEDLTINSDDGRYVISPVAPLVTDTTVNIEPYIITTENVLHISKPSNLGIKFINGITTGADVESYNDNSPEDIQFLDFILKLDSNPTSETFTIFDTNSTINKKLVYTSSGFQKTGDFNIYLDGELIDSGATINVGDFYHIAINFNSVAPTKLYFGVDRNVENALSGSVGLITINPNEPSSITSYLQEKYQSLIGRFSIVFNESDQLVISDSSTSNSFIYLNDGKYFEMQELPKIKIIEDRWQTISVPE